MSSDESGAEFVDRCLSFARKAENDLGEKLNSRTIGLAAMAALRASGELQQRLNQLEKRLVELEKAPLMYDGPHEPAKTYRKGTFVTHGGSVWHCNYTTTSKPGDGPAWTLAVKRGKDAQ